jgi:hypothetical protein
VTMCGMNGSAVTGMLLLVAVACGEPPEAVSIVITNVTVIDPATRQVLADQSVFVAGDRIRALEPSAGRSRFVATDTIDGTGRFLIPGLIDSHAHVGRDTERIESSFALMVANGVTGIRLLGAHCRDPDPDEVCLDGFRAMAAAIDAGQREGPRLLRMGSSGVNGPIQRPEDLPDSLFMFFPGTPEEGRALAHYMQAQGVDLIKIYNTIPRAAYFALLEEATSLGLEASGHIPYPISVVEASDAGQRTIEHARDLPLACSTYSPEYRSLGSRAMDGDASVRGPSPIERLAKTLEGYDATLCDDVMNTLVANGTYLVPTHGTREMDARAGEEAYRNDPRLKYIPDRQRQGWEADLDNYADSPPDLVALYREFYDAGLRMTAMAHAAGVKVMVGTDANDTMIFPGFGVHDELRRFADAGIAPMDILRAATTVPSEYLGRTEDLGGISAGKLADLVLLDADPLADIRNSTSINSVLMAGRVYDRAALDGLLSRAEASEETAPTASESGTGDGVR